MDKQPLQKSDRVLPVFLFSILVVASVAAVYIYVRDKKKTPENPPAASQNSTVAQSQRSYNLKLTSDIGGIQPGQTTKISYEIINDKGEVLKDYTVAHEKIMHFIVVRKDLQYFQHLHPDFNQQAGEFSINVTFPTDGPYRIFPDFTPTPENPEKLTVTVNRDLNVGDMSKYKPQAVVADTSTNKTVDGLKVSYTFPDTLKAQTPIDYELVVEQPGEKEPVMLEPYLGAMGHGVILRESNLDFIHTHAEGMDMTDMGSMSMDTGSMGNMVHKGEPDTMDFSATFPEPGTYKIFTQFQVNGKVHTSDYTVNVK